eukprot:TRINITY_DN60665_c0_g1_i1.p1 TRINITY_DN60665_c0_g1~~TRINITY_DN60665_c0_g1_i1.p1  ORF type:complete len:322 (+),score=102.44 TRINITY_DN60665_c0_g1_i1:78-968(+)
MVAADQAACPGRRSRHPGTVNLADLGGVPLQQGGVTRSGVLFRSAAPAYYTAEGLRHLEEDLGVRAAVDLRGHKEAMRGRTREAAGEAAGAELLHGGLRWRNFDVATKAARRRIRRVGTCWSKTRMVLWKLCCRNDWVLGEATVLLGIGPEGRGPVALYLTFLEDGAEELGEVLRHLASRVRAGVPTVFHCTAGKDRAGLIAALLLSLAGASDPDIVADYAVSAAMLKEHPHVFEQQETAHIRHMHNDIIYESPAEAMQEALEFVREQLGGVEQYLLGPCGLTAADVRDLRRALAP